MTFRGGLQASPFFPTSYAAVMNLSIHGYQSYDFAQILKPVNSMAFLQHKISSQLTNLQMQFMRNQEPP
ncbi:MAG: hypothetical protein D5R98_06390 [Desulfonatronovibrio sp. MSAO_Bac4]|nr:MAG: hypothetical protein D5R98_06390 [Desulfonatronovibrio sp. MSAO_Bac4]